MSGLGRAAPKLFASLLTAIVILGIIWSVGGPVGAVLNAPGLLLMRGAAALGIPGPGAEPSLREWLWLGTALSTLFWWLVAFSVLVVAGRRRRAGPGGGPNAGAGP